MAMEIEIKSFTIRVTKDSTVKIEDREIYGQTMCCLIVDGLTYDMHFKKHEIGRPQLRKLVEEDMQKVIDAIEFDGKEIAAYPPPRPTRNRNKTGRRQKE